MAVKINDDCIFCGSCVVNCPLGAISTSDFHLEIDPHLCTSCGTCASVCPMDAIQLTEMPDRAVR
jgi:ferredoxin